MAQKKASNAQHSFKIQTHIHTKRATFLQVTGYAHGTGDHLRHIVCIIVWIVFLVKKQLDCFKQLDRLNDRSFGSFFKNDRGRFKNDRDRFEDNRDRFKNDGDRFKNDGDCFKR